MHTNMSASGITIATTTTNADSAAAACYESGVSDNTINNANVSGSELRNSEEENSSFCNLPSLKELQSSPLYNELQYNKVPTGNSKKTVDELPQNEVENLASSKNFFNDYVRQGDVENILSSQLSPGLTLLQQNAAASSPPPHSYRHSRAYRHFKNPPQPHMCIRSTTEAGEELFINVLSWTRIVIPQEPSDPIPLYGGMRVPPGSPRSPPIVFAVMANPEVLKDSGRHSKDPEERRAMVELMCDFVEAMNPGVKLVRNAIILKDRDISGELKDVWNAVQAQRDREREEQMVLQRQQHQQHIHSLTNGSSMSNSSSFPATNTSANAATTISHQMFSKTMHSNNTGDETVLMAVDSSTPPSSRKYLHEVQNVNKASNIDIDKNIEMTKINNDQVPLALSTEHLDNKTSITCNEKCEKSSTKHHNDENTTTNDALSNGNNSKEFLAIDRTAKTNTNNQLNVINSNSEQKKAELVLTNGSIAKCNDLDMSNMSKTTDASATTNSAMPIPALNPPTSIAPFPNAQQAPTKKEKLGGFLPNGCIFPRFTKNNKHKDKDKDKEPKTKDKEKNAILSALKKSKDKKSNAAKTTATNSNEKITSSNSKITATNVNNSNIKPQKNCLQQLECGVQKLDLNSHHHHTHIVGPSIISTPATNTTNNTSETNKKTSSITSNNDIDAVQ